MRKLLAILVFAAVFDATAHAQDMVYKPKNPAFGGDTFNYQWLQASAQAQNSLKDPNATPAAGSSLTNINDFQESLNRQILSALSRQIITDQFGEEGLRPGSYTIGNFSVDVTSSLDGLVVDILDQATGQSTQVIIPFF